MITLMYHDVFATSPSESGFQNESAFRYKIDIVSFERQIEIVKHVIEVKKWTKNDVVFSFDDGGVSAYTIVAPLLEKHGFKGVFFISTKYIGTPGFLSVEHIKDLKSRGHIIGSHSHTHPANITEKNIDLQQEWLESKRILENICGEIETCSIPNGYQSKNVFDIISKSGYQSVYTSCPNTETQIHKRIKVLGRFGIHNDTTDLNLSKVLTSKLYRAKLGIRWRVLSIAKSLLGDKYHSIKLKLLS